MRNQVYDNTSDNILEHDEETRRKSFGTITAGRKSSGSCKQFIARYLYDEGIYMVFITKQGEVIRNRSDCLAYLKKVA